MWRKTMERVQPQSAELYEYLRTYMEESIKAFSIISAATAGIGTTLITSYTYQKKNCISFNSIYSGKYS